MTDILNVIDNLPEEERLLFLSAREVKNSLFWKYMLNDLDERAMECNGQMMTGLMSGNEKAALIAAAKIQAIGWLLETIEGITQDVEDEALNQG